MTRLLGLSAVVLALGVATAPAALAKPAVEQPGGAVVKVDFWNVEISETGLGPVLKATVRNLPVGYNALLVDARYEVLTGCLKDGSGKVAPGTQERHEVTAGTRYWTFNEESGATWRPRSEEDFGMSEWPEMLLPESCPAGYVPGSKRAKTLDATVRYTSEASGTGPSLPMKSKLIWQD